MSPTSPSLIELSDPQRAEPARLVRAGRTEQRLAQRAGIVPLAADGYPNSAIAASLGVCADTARKWRRRWCAAPGVSSLDDAKRSGRPAVLTAVQVAGVKKRWPAGHPARAVNRCPGGHARNWHGRQSRTGICKRISPATVRRWLVQDAIKTVAVPVRCSGC